MIVSDDSANNEVPQGDPITAVVVDERWADVMARALVEAEAPRLRCRLLVGGGLVPSGFERYGDALAAADTAELVDPQRGGPMFYTSGTTGWPKGVRHPANATARMRATSAPSRCLVNAVRPRFTNVALAGAAISSSC